MAAGGGWRRWSSATSWRERERQPRRQLPELRQDRIGPTTREDGSSGANGEEKNEREADDSNEREGRGHEWRRLRRQRSATVMVERTGRRSTTSRGSWEAVAASGGEGGKDGSGVSAGLVAAMDGGKQRGIPAMHKGETEAAGEGKDGGGRGNHGDEKRRRREGSGGAGGFQQEERGEGRETVEEKKKGAEAGKVCEGKNRHTLYRRWKPGSMVVGATRILSLFSYP